MKPISLFLSVAFWSRPKKNLFTFGFLTFSRKDYANAMHFLRPLAEQGYADAQAYVGQMYGEGLGVIRSYTQEVLWFRKAAEQGNRLAQYQLALEYQFGYGVPQNYAEAMKWFMRGAKRGDPLAQAAVGMFYIKGYGHSPFGG